MTIDGEPGRMPLKNPSGKPKSVASADLGGERVEEQPQPKHKPATPEEIAAFTVHGQ